MTTTVAPAVLGTGAMALAASMDADDNPRALTTDVAERTGPDTVYTWVTVTLVVALVGVTVANPRERR